MPYTDKEKQLEAMRKVNREARERTNKKIIPTEKAISQVTVETGINEIVKHALEITKNDNWVTGKYGQRPLKVLAYYEISALRENTVKLINDPTTDRNKLVFSLDMITKLLFRFNLASYFRQLETVKDIALLNSNLTIYPFVLNDHAKMAIWLKQLVDAFKGTITFEATETAKQEAINATKIVLDKLLGKPKTVVTVESKFSLEQVFGIDEKIQKEESEVKKA